MKIHFKNQPINLILPSIVFGAVTGIFTAVTVMFYKLAAEHIISLSQRLYSFLRGHLYLLPPALAILLGIAFVLAFVYKRTPNLKGGGIPTSVAILRGLITFKWLRNIIGVFILSLLSFLCGVPLGNEGPSVQMGTAIGKGTVCLFAKKHSDLDKYSMTGGACAGFSVATGAPISGVLFAIEEAHRSISPMIIIVAAVSVIFANITSGLMSPVLGVETALFGKNELIKLSLKDIWLPILIGAAVGLFAVLFLNYYRAICAFFSRALKKIPPQYKIFAVLGTTLIAGLFSDSFISTGHHLMLSLFDSSPAVYMLLLILIVRSTLTLCANTNGITGGMFVPLLVLGALISAVLGKTLIPLCGMGQEYYPVILTLGIVACIASIMKMPITAVVFAVEALGCYSNIVYVLTVCAVSYIITEIFGVKSINDTAIDDKIEEMARSHAQKAPDTL